MSETTFPFIYKTIRSYYPFEEYIKSKLQEYSINNNINNQSLEGYLISKAYLDYWKQYTNYEQIKKKISTRDYYSSRDIIYQYRKNNPYQIYQADAIQYIFNSAEDFINVAKKGHSFALIDKYFWNLICEDKGVDESGGVLFNLGKNTITLHFNKSGSCEVITLDNIIDNSKDINLLNRYLQRNYPPQNGGFNNNNYSLNGSKRSNLGNNPEELELQKILLLYAFEQELKKKINNITYKDNHFKSYYLISKEWIEEYKKCYHYDEICKMIQKKEDLKNYLNNGYDNAKEKMDLILKKISFINNKKIKFPEALTDNNTFLTAREDANISGKYSISYWKNFELVNEDLLNLFSKSESHNYNFDNISEAKCLICCGKVIIELSLDDYNQNEHALEIGMISNNGMIYNDEFIFRYENEESKKDNLNNFKKDFLSFQRENLNFGMDLECDLLSQKGEPYGTAYKIPPFE